MRVVDACRVTLGTACDKLPSLIIEISHVRLLTRFNEYAFVNFINTFYGRRGAREEVAKWCAKCSLHTDRYDTTL